MIQPADVLVENSIACFIRNGFLIYCTILESNQNYMLWHADDRGCSTMHQYNIQKRFEYLEINME